MAKFPGHCSRKLSQLLNALALGTGSRGRAGTRQRSRGRSSLRPLRREVERRLAAGRRGGPQTAGPGRAILRRREALWTCGPVAGGEPTKQTAARALRPGGLWRQGRGGTPSAEGSRVVGRPGGEGVQLSV